ncbi:MAG TPA: hypothetical protein VGA61_19150 [Anaerolineae bacterium]
MRKIAPLLTLVLTLAVAYGCDRLLGEARSLAVAHVSVPIFQWLLVLTNLVFAACILGLAWLALVRPGRSRGAAALFMLVGLLLLLLPAPPFWSITAGAPGNAYAILQASPYSFFGKASAFATVIGAAGLIVGPGQTQA